MVNFFMFRVMKGLEKSEVACGMHKIQFPHLAINVYACTIVCAFSLFSLLSPLCKKGKLVGKQLICTFISTSHGTAQHNRTETYHPLRW